MKKILTCIFTLAMMAGLAACGNAQGGGSGSGYSNKVLEDKDSYGWAVHGNNVLADGTDNGWNGKANEVYEKSLMTAQSIEGVSKIDKAVADKLAAKEVKYLYVYEGLQLGTKSAGWTTRFLGDDGKVYIADGSYCAKVVKLTYDSEDEVYSEAQWIPHDHDGRTEALTDNVWLGPWQEKADDNGFSWDYNPTIKGGQGGTYTVIIAQYVAGENDPVYGIGFVKTADAEEPLPIEEEIPVEDHTYGVIGSFEGSGWATDVAMVETEEGSGIFVAEVELKAEDEFKVRADGDWKINYGAAAVSQEDCDPLTLEALDLSGDNIKVTADGMFSIYFFEATEMIVIAYTPAN